MAGQLPMWAVGLFWLALAIAAARSPNWALRGRHWMVPKSWARFGSVPYASAFGVVLGIALLTRLPSVTFYALLAYGLSSQPAAVVLAFIGFGLVRVMPFSVIGLIRNSDEQLLRNLKQLSNLGRRASLWEPALLGCMAGAAFFSR